MKARAIFTIDIDLGDAEEGELLAASNEICEALKDYLYDANNTRPYETDPRIDDVHWEIPMYPSKTLKKWETRG